MDRRVYWLWLQHAFGAGSYKPWALFNRFPGGAAEFYEGGAALWNSMDFVTEKEARQLFAFSLQEAEVVLELSEKMKHQVLTPECEKYPEALRNIFDPPAVLYVKGTLPDVDSVPAIAVVGTRKAGRRALDAATTISYQLASGGAVVVSGGALGIDTAAHRGAMRAMGKTVCVLPSGISDGYLVENYTLRQRIAEEGALVTEYPMNTPVTRGTFQVRNRLMSGLCCGVLIAEAPAKSGALITARLAKEQDRDVFVLPGAPGDPACAGSDALMEDGAKAVHTGEEILTEYQNRFRPLPERPKKQMQRIALQKSPAPVLAEPVSANAQPEEGQGSLPENGRQVMAALSASTGALHVSKLQEETGLSPAQLLGILTQLELQGLVQAHSGRRYQISKQHEKI